MQSPPTQEQADHDRGDDQRLDVAELHQCASAVDHGCAAVVADVLQHERVVTREADVEVNVEREQRHDQYRRRADEPGDGEGESVPPCARGRLGRRQLGGGRLAQGCGHRGSTVPTWCGLRPIALRRLTDRAGMIGG